MRISRYLFAMAWLGLAVAMSQSSAVEPRQLLLQDIDRYVYCLVSEDDQNRQLTGTGVQIEPGLIATVAHQVSGMTRITAYRGQYAVSPGRVVAIDPAHDIALLRIKSSPGGVALSAQQSQPKQAKIYQIGCPYGLFHATLEGKLVSAETKIEGKPVMVLDMPIQQGDSGGPVIDAQGRWIGLVTGFLNNKQNVGLATSVHYLEQLLKEWKWP